MARAPFIAPLVLLIVGLGLLIGGIEPAWWIVLIVAVGVAAILLLALPARRARDFR